MSYIVTIPPYARYVEKALGSSIVSGLRLNTVLPVKDPLENIVAGLSKRCSGKTLWIDLKSRQLRVTKAAYVPYAHVELSHSIEVELPCRVLLNGGSVSALCTAIEGNLLILEDLPPLPLGAGMSLNITSPSLKIFGFLTDRDRAYVTAARETGNHHYMLSFVEKSSDIEELLAMDPKGHILAKIESQKGLDWVRDEYTSNKALWRERVHLVAARGDLYVELSEPENLPKHLRDIIEADGEAVAASRIYESFCSEKSEKPSCAEIMDLSFLEQMGYRQFLLGDELGFRESSLLRALKALERKEKNG